MLGSSLSSPQATNVQPNVSTAMTEYINLFIIFNFFQFIQSSILLISRILVFDRDASVGTDLVGGNRTIPTDVTVGALHGCLAGDVLTELHVVAYELLGAAEVHPAVSLGIELTGTLVENEVDLLEGEVASGGVFRLVGTE